MFIKFRLIFRFACDFHSSACERVKRRIRVSRETWQAWCKRRASSDLAKMTLLATKKGNRSIGRQKKRWEDNIVEWIRIDFASSTRAAENKTKCEVDDLARSWNSVE